MSVKTEKQIERDFFEFVKKSALAGAISGTVYRKDMRPPNSEKEDIIVKFLAGLDRQIQSGIVVLNIYVPDKSVKALGRKAEDIKRIGQLQELLQSFIETNDSTEYDIESDVTPKTLEAEGIEQHFIYARIKFKRITV